MTRTPMVVIAALAMVLIASSAAAAPAVTAIRGAGLAPERQAPRIPGRYIVVFEDAVPDPGTLTDRLATALGFTPTQRYSHAIEGFAAPLSDGVVAALRADPKVAFVAPDRPATVIDAVPLVKGDSAPPGVRRIEAAGTTVVQETSAVPVAVIDTGVDIDHPDLTVRPGTNCMGSGPPDDDNGHGTHVAGTIAARNNGTGVTGVAPGTTVFAVKVLDAQGSGGWSSIICGLDWIVGTRTDSDPTNDVGVANLSLGSSGLPHVVSGDGSTASGHLHINGRGCGRRRRGRQRGGGLRRPADSDCARGVPRGPHRHRDVGQRRPSRRHRVPSRMPVRAAGRCCGNVLELRHHARWDGTHDRRARCLHSVDGPGRIWPLVRNEHGGAARDRRDGPLPRRGRRRRPMRRAHDVGSHRSRPHGSRAAVGFRRFQLPRRPA
jgi:Subtilase family/Peptidase inhibitor I9